MSTTPLLPALDEKYELSHDERRALRVVLFNEERYPNFPIPELRARLVRSDEEEYEISREDVIDSVRRQSYSTAQTERMVERVRTMDEATLDLIRIPLLCELGEPDAINLDVALSPEEIRYILAGIKVEYRRENNPWVAILCLIFAVCVAAVSISTGIFVIDRRLATALAIWFGILSFIPFAIAGLILYRGQSMWREYEEAKRALLAAYALAGPTGSMEGKDVKVEA